MWHSLLAYINLTFLGYSPSLVMYMNGRIEAPPSLLGDSSDFSRPITPAETDDSDEVSLHNVYYFEDYMVTFLVSIPFSHRCTAGERRIYAHQVEGRLFKIHRHFLARDSERFRAMDSSQDPIELAEVTIKEFECLLNFFYQGYDVSQFF
jgi:hypothetical protein